MSTSTELRRIVGAMTERPWASRPWPEFGVDGPSYPICTVNQDDDRRPLLGEDKAQCDTEDVAAIATLANHAEALVKLVDAVERYAQDPTGFHFDRLRVALADVHAIKGEP